MICAVTELKEKLNASDFGKKVLALTEESLTGPNFGVEQISEKLGISPSEYLENIVQPNALPLQLD